MGQVIELANLDAGDAVSMGLIEGALTHIRLLDEFFKTPKRPPRYPNQLIARDWLPAWRCEAVISQPIRNEIGAYLAHMSALRQTGRQWPLPTMTDDCCRVFRRFLEQLERDRPDRAKPLLWCHDVLAEWDSAAPPVRGFTTSTTSSSTLWWRSSPPGV